MQMTKTHKIFMSITVIAVLFGAYVYFDRKSLNKTNTGIETVVATTTSGTQITTQGSGGYTIEQVPITETQSFPKPIPDLNRPVRPVGSAPVSTESIILSTQKILPLQMLLKKNQTDVSMWIGLGIYQKIAGDYEGSVLSWQYAVRLSPKDFVALGNLGDLYANFLKDYGKSEMYYKQAISNGPMQTNLYIQLSQVYQYQFNDLNKARAIIDQGLKQIPNDINLLQIKANLSK